MASGWPPRAQKRWSEGLVAWQPLTAPSLTNDACMAAATCSGGRAGFLLTRIRLTERQVRGVRARQISQHNTSHTDEENVVVCPSSQSGTNN